MQARSPTVLLAGRRPDPEGAGYRRFPIENAVLVRERLRAFFVDREPRHLVCSAACGADLLALDVAGDLGVERHVVLPFDVGAFKASSVTDRPGSWGALYDRVVREVEAAGGLTVLSADPDDDDDAYAAVNGHLLQTAQGVGAPVLAVAVWEGRPRGDGDLTAHLLDTATEAGASTDSLSTL